MKVTVPVGMPVPGGPAATVAVKVIARNLVPLTGSAIRPTTVSATTRVMTTWSVK